MCLFQFWFPQGICIGVGLLSHMVVLFPDFWGISILPSIVTVSVYIPTNSAREFSFLHTLSRIYCLQNFDDGHSDQCEVISHCSFDLHFSNNERCWASFHVFVSHFLIELFVFLVLSCMSCLYILEINPLSVVSFAILPFWGLSFHLAYSVYGHPWWSSG